MHTLHIHAVVEFTKLGTLTRTGVVPLQQMIGVSLNEKLMNYVCWEHKCNKGIGDMISAIHS